MEGQKKKIALIGGGPSAMFMYKRLVEAGRRDLSIFIFEKSSQLGAGMPYSPSGANEEHITNVSDNEIPTIVTSIEEWVKNAPEALRQRFGINENNFNEYKVLPRLFFGEYLSAQFGLLIRQAKEAGIETVVRYKTEVADVIDDAEEDCITIIDADGQKEVFDAVVICTGHRWPKKHEGKVPRYFDSPYPPAKLRMKISEPVAIRGASLTAIDAIRTLARENGLFEEAKDGKLYFKTSPGSEEFRLVLYSRSGLLPAVRFHLEDSHLAKDSVLSPEVLAEAMELNEGFVPLNFLYRKNFLEPLREQDPAYHETVKDLSMEEFVENTMALRERLDPFQLFKAEYKEADTSIKRRESVSWKERLAVLSFALNYPAKHLPAEDMLRLQKTLMPLVSLVIAFVPQSSARELLALYDAGILSLVSVGEDSKVEPQADGGAMYHYTDEDGAVHEVSYNYFVDCIGQPHMKYEDFPFKSLLEKRVVTPAQLRFRSAEEGKQLMEEGTEGVKQAESGEYYLTVSGIAINDYFQVVDSFGVGNERLYIMAVPYIGGYNPDYSGLDFGEAASARIIKRLLATEKSKAEVVN